MFEEQENIIPDTLADSSNSEEEETISVTEEIPTIVPPLTTAKPPPVIVEHQPHDAHSQFIRHQLLPTVSPPPTKTPPQVQTPSPPTLDPTLSAI